MKYQGRKISKNNNNNNNNNSNSDYQLGDSYKKVQ